MTRAGNTLYENKKQHKQIVQSSAQSRDNINI